MLRVLGAAAAIALGCGGALAGPLSGNLNAMEGWTGTAVLDDYDGLQAEVDYAVFAPGDFSYAGYTPTPGEYVYAYQVFPIGDLEVTCLAIAMLESNEANNIGYFVLSGGTVPSSSSLDELNAAWFFGGTGLLPGQSSIGLVLSSINEPTVWFGSVADNGHTAMDFLPSPSNLIPEPATMGLLLAGALGLLRRKGR